MRRARASGVEKRESRGQIKRRREEMERAQTAHHPEAVYSRCMYCSDFSYAKKHAALAGKLRMRQGVRPR